MMTSQGVSLVCTPKNIFFSITALGHRQLQTPPENMPHMSLTLRKGEIFPQLCKERQLSIISIDILSHSFHSLTNTGWIGLPRLARMKLSSY